MENLYEPLIKLIEEKQKIIQMILDSDGPTKPGSQRTIRLKGNLEAFNTVIELINKINQCAKTCGET